MGTEQSSVSSVEDIEGYWRTIYIEWYWRDIWGWAIYIWMILEILEGIYSRLKTSHTSPRHESHPTLRSSTLLHLTATGWRSSLVLGASTPAHQCCGGDWQLVSSKSSDNHQGRMDTEAQTWKVSQTCSLTLDKSIKTNTKLTNILNLDRTFLHVFCRNVVFCWSPLYDFRSAGCSNSFRLPTK
jgi:hypothetical protein